MKACWTKAAWRGPGVRRLSHKRSHVHILNHIFPILSAVNTHGVLHLNYSSGEKTAGLYSAFLRDGMEPQLRKASSAGILSNNVIRAILHSECSTKGKMSVENIARHAGAVMDTLFCAVGSVGSLELPLAQAGFHWGTSTAQETHKHKAACTENTSSLLEIFLHLNMFHY